MLEKYFKANLHENSFTSSEYRIFIQYDINDARTAVTNFIPFIYIHEIQGYFNMKKAYIYITI